jgi:hypothetical protein
LFQSAVTHAAIVVMKKDLNEFGWKFGRLHDSANRHHWKMVMLAIREAVKNAASIRRDSSAHLT